MTKRTIPFTTFQEINRLSKNKKILFFGAGNIAEKTFRMINRSSFYGIIDNSKNLWGEKQLDKEVLPPEKISSIESILIIITTTSFNEVTKQLEQMNLMQGQDFLVSPILNDLRIINEMESINKKIIFSSGAANTSTKFGGGIYELNVIENTWNYEKKINGTYHGLIKYRDKYLGVDSSVGIIEFDRKYNISNIIDLPSASRAHGVDFSEKYNCYFVACSYLDQVLQIGNDGNILNTFNLSEKSKYKQNSPQHHCNDCCVHEDSLFVSMFSCTGNWKIDVFDGAIIEYNIITGERVGVVKTDLWMPHNVKIINGSMTCLDSLRGSLLTNNLQEIGKFNAFTRGLDFDGEYYYIGQSRNRNFSKNLGLSNNISIDAGVVVFDSITKVSRFLQLPPQISEIHALIVED